jgi:hypothetical protein
MVMVVCASRLYIAYGGNDLARLGAASSPAIEKTISTGKGG